MLGRQLKFAAIFATLAVVAAAVAAGASSAPRTTSAKVPCSAIPNKPPNDPDGILAKLKLPKSILHDYVGWGYPITASVWANWKPKHAAPYKVAVVWTSPDNPFNAYLLHMVQKDLKKNKLVDPNLILTTASSQTAITEQVQQFNAAIQQKPDIIITSPLSAPALTPMVETAGKAGIPTIAFFNPIDNKYAINVQRNTYENATDVASQLVNALGGKGNVLEVNGTPSSATSGDSQAAWRTVLNDCPDIHIVGSVYGFFSTALTKTMVLQWLSTHSTKVDAVIETSAMGQGIQDAFQQAGVAMPVLGLIQLEKSNAAYWSQNASKGYTMAADVGGAESYANLIAQTTVRTLAGQGPKINLLIWRLPVVTQATLKNYLNSSWTTSTPGAVEDKKATWWTNADIARFFNHPNLLKGTAYNNKKTAGTAG
jgi:ABC-type sugar transport system substrate-binding protein